MQEQVLIKESELEAVGKVVKVENGFAWVSTQRQTGCSGCQSEKGCGTSTLAKLFALESKTPLKLHNSLNVQVGQQVLLSLDGADLIKHSLMAYGLPLLGLFVGAAALQWALQGVFNSEFPSVVGGFLGLLGGWLLTRTLYKPVQPTLKSIIS